MISLIMFAILLALPCFMSASSGSLWGIFAVGGSFAVVAVFAGPRGYRIVGAIGLALSLCLIHFDLEAGKRLRERLHQQDTIQR